MSSPLSPLLCLKCGIERKEFMPGGIDDKCPNCGYKEGCCGDSGAVSSPRIERDVKEF